MRCIWQQWDAHRWRRGPTARQQARTAEGISESRPRRRSHRLAQHRRFRGIHRPHRCRRHSRRGGPGGGTPCHGRRGCSRGPRARPPELRTRPVPSYAPCISRRQPRRPPHLWPPPSADPASPGPRGPHRKPTMVAATAGKEAERGVPGVGNLRARMCPVKQSRAPRASAPPPSSILYTVIAGAEPRRVGFDAWGAAWLARAGLTAGHRSSCGLGSGPAMADAARGRGSRDGHGPVGIRDLLH